MMVNLSTHPVDQDIKLLDPLTFAIQGRQLIEASAGTGKTFTISTLYLRLILGHGPIASKGALSPKDILVVTFTEAATQELRDRIRKRLMSAKQSAIELEFALETAEFSAQILAGEPFDEELNAQLAQWDPVVVAMLKAQQGGQEALVMMARRWVKRLENCANQMDEAEIFTIHGFCQRMLKRHAFESGSLFESELAPDTEALRHHAIFDFWRKRLYEADEALVDEMLGAYSTPYALAKDISSMWNSQDARIEPKVTDIDLATEIDRFNEKAAEFKRAWLANTDDLFVLLQSSGVDKRSYSKRHLPNWLEKISQWCSSDETALTDKKIREPLEKLTQTKLVEKTKKGQAPYHPLFSAIEDLLAAAVPVKAILLGQAITEVRRRFDQQKQQSQLLSFDDLLGNLDKALSGPHQQQLSEAIRSQFPVALIDEFQDTDQKQFRIFSNIYPLATSTEQNPSTNDHALVMIGDPKQAIYGFRGADIFTYIQAKRSATQVWTLGTNWRSTQSMIAGVNQVFEYSQAPFIYQTDIPFLPVKAAGNADKTPFSSSADPVPEDTALVLWHLAADSANTGNRDELLSSGQYLSTFSHACALEIQSLLAPNTSAIGDEPLQAGDIAVLVRNRQEAAAIRDALLSVGLASVYLSNRDSVYSSQEAQDIARVLAGVLQPQNERLLKAALASPLFALSYGELDQLNNDERRWELLVNEFEDYNQCWRSQGVLPMLRRLLHQRGVAARLMAEPAGERRLTDYLHLAELLQTASAELESQTALLRWLANALANANGQLEEQQLRLESEQNLVQIVTIHKSKGLEYPVVFLPFICKPPRKPNPLYHDDDDTLIWHLEADSEVNERARKEQLAEELRLLYVALTRPVYRCYLGIADVKEGNGKSLSFTKTALGYLLNSAKGAAGEKEVEAASDTDEKTAFEFITDFAHSSALSDQCVRVCAPPQLDESGHASPRWESDTQSRLDEKANQGERADSLKVRHLSQRIERTWRVTSYSGLTYQHSHSGHTAGVATSVGAAATDTAVSLPDSLAGGSAMDMDAIKDTQLSHEAAAGSEVEQGPSIFTFAKGAHAGTFLHTLFEQVSFPQVDAPNLVDEVSQQCELAGFDVAPWAPVLTDLVRQVVSQPLVPNSWCLQNIDDSDRWVEMEFTLPIEHLNAHKLDLVCRVFDPLSQQASKVDFDQVSGMLKGFIDLLVRIDGKYYVLDYKSNHLGMQPSDYSQAAMATAMIDHRYDLQYQIYSLALHRLLSLRLPDYDFEHHFGGVYYLFLRGMTRSSESLGEGGCTDQQGDKGIFYTRPSESFIKALDALFKGEAVDMANLDSNEFEGMADEADVQVAGAAVSPPINDQVHQEANKGTHKDIIRDKNRDTSSDTSSHMAEPVTLDLFADMEPNTQTPSQKKGKPS